MPANPNANYTNSALRIGDIDPYPQRLVGEFIATVVANAWVNDEYKHIVLKVHAHALKAYAGQMFHLLCPSPASTRSTRRPNSASSASLSPKYRSNRLPGALRSNSTKRSMSLRSRLKSPPAAEPNTSSRRTPKSRHSAASCSRCVSMSPIMAPAHMGRDGLVASRAAAIQADRSGRAIMPRPGAPVAAIGPIPTGLFVCASALAAQRIGGAARVGAGLHNAALLVDIDRADRTGGPDPLRPALDLVATARQFGDHCLGNARLDRESPGIIVVGRERRGIAVAGKTRAFDRALHVLAKHETIEQHLQHGLGLHVAAGGAEWHETPAALDRQRRVRGQPRAFAGCRAGRMARVGPRLRAAVRRDEPGPRHHRRTVGAVARC